MLYHFLAPLADDYQVFNLFNYITFRAAGATATAVFLVFLFGPSTIRYLKERNLGQIVRADGPASHQAKRGTPTMGGVIILISMGIPTLHCGLAGTTGTYSWRCWPRCGWAASG